MNYFFNKVALIFRLCRGYSIPISAMSCVVPFLYAFFNKGNILFGIIASIGVVILHLATNLFDDVIDYYREKKQIELGIKSDFNFQPSKCFYIRNGSVSFNQALLISFFLYLISFLIGIFFVYSTGFKLLYILLPSAVICLLYPLLGCLGLGEILVATIFSPLIYSGIYFVMTNSFDSNIFIFSVSTGLFAVAVLHNHMLLDYKFDTTNRKITLCRICGSEYNALLLLIFIISVSYINLLFWIFMKYLSVIYLLPLITIPVAIILIKVMRIHIVNPNQEIKYNILMGNIKSLYKLPVSQRNFLMKFVLAQNILYSFSIMLCISIIIDYMVLR